MKLKTEEKFAFLQLCQHIAKVDGEYSLKERNVINEYCMEMGIDNVEIDQEQFILEDNLAVYTTRGSQKIAMLSLMVLIHIDHKFGIYIKQWHKLHKNLSLKKNNCSIFQCGEKQLLRCTNKR